MEAVAAGDEVAGDLVARAVLVVADARAVHVEVVNRHVRGLVHGRQVGRAARIHQIARQLGLAVDHHALAARQAFHVDAVAPTAPEHLETAVDQTLAMHARADADVVQEIDAHLLENAGADAAEHVLAGLALDDHGVDARLGQELPQQQARGAGADDRDLRSGSGGHGSTLRTVGCSTSAGSMPWRRFVSVAAGEAMNARSARAPTGRRECAPTAPENVVTIWIAGGSGPSTVDAFDVTPVPTVAESRAPHRRAPPAFPRECRGAR